MNSFKRILLYTLLVFCPSLKMEAQNLDSLFNEVADTTNLYNERLMNISKIVKAYKIDFTKVAGTYVFNTIVMFDGAVDTY